MTDTRPASPPTLVLAILLVTPVLATPPAVPWKTWERTARAEGAAAVRDSYRLAIDEMTVALRNMPGDGTRESFEKRLILTGSLIEHLDSWVLVELRETHVNGRVPELDDVIWPQLIVEASSVLSLHDVLATKAQPSQAARVTGQLEPWSIRLAGALNENVDHLAWRMALLGKASDNPSRVEHVFGLFGGEIRGHSNPQAFVSTNHDVPRLIHMAPALRQGAQRHVPVARSLQDAASRRIHELKSAVDDHDEVLMRRLLRDVDSMQENILEPLSAALGGSDLEGASFVFVHQDPQVIQVRVAGIITRRGSGRAHVVHVRTLVFRFRATLAGLRMIGIGGLR
jgi:hypothetical protein